ncbi:MAG: type II secretion system F family protein, partial [Pseudomonadota bacterium]
LDTQKTMMYTLGPGGVGYYLPQYFIDKRVEERKTQITSGFPDALDMLLVCVEAGQSLDQAITRVSKELHASVPALAEELTVVSYEMKAGKDKTMVLNDFGERCGVVDVSSFVTVLIQSAAFGTSIAESLRVYAAEMRDKRVMRAEEAANKLPTKMTLATMTLTVPPLLIILVAPSVHGITQIGTLGPGGS